MKKSNEAVYLKLQRHLDRQAIGFPATWRGVELTILRQIFTPEEALIASCLTYKYEPLETIYSRARHLVASPEELKQLLDQIYNKGGLECQSKGFQKRYANTPLVVGMYEFQVGKLTPELVEAFNAYTSNKVFGVSFLSTKLPQMRTIPISKSIRPQNTLLLFDEVATLLAQADPPFAFFACICRQKKSLEGETCKVTARQETCFAAGELARPFLENGQAREVSRDEVLAILEKNQKEGLVLQPSNTTRIDFICSCCGCCCGMLNVHKQLPRPLDYWASNYYAAVDDRLCNGCGNCTKRCQVDAAAVSTKTGRAEIDLTRCIGCGLCVPACPRQAIQLVKKTIEQRPPKTRADLLEIIMSEKKGPWGKIKLAGKLIFDAIRTGQTHLLKESMRH